MRSAGDLLHQCLSFPNRQRPCDNLEGNTSLIGFAGQRQEGTGVAHRQRARGNLRSHVVRQAEQTKVIGDRSAIFPDCLGNLLLLQVKLVGEPAVRYALQTRSVLRFRSPSPCQRDNGTTG